MSTVATRTAVELLHVQPETWRAKAALQALQDAAVGAGMELETSSTYQGSAPWLVLWGPGEPVRAGILRRHVAAGGRAVVLDLAYWSRATKHRISIDAPHPQKWVMKKAWPRSRFEADPCRVANLWNPEGPIIIAGIGRKATVQYGAAVVERWEAEMAAACRRRWPKRSVIMRPKPTVPVEPDAALAGAGLVVTWHSNLAVDAIRLGIPAVCRDGAAAAVCLSELPIDPQPLPVAVRDQFLANVSFFQWGVTPAEAAGCWAFLREVLT